MGKNKFKIVFILQRYINEKYLQRSFQNKRALQKDYIDFENNVYKLLGRYVSLDDF